MNALIIGLGLIGGSLAKAFKHHNIAQHITVFDPNQNSCNLALEQKVANEICYDLTKISQYQIIVIACPLLAFVNVAPIVFKFADKNALIFDVGSLKNFAELDFASIKPNFDSAIFKNFPANFVPAHPIAGSHLTGYENSCENLFADKDFVICPYIYEEYGEDDDFFFNKQEYHRQFVEQLQKIIEKIGAKPLYLTAQEHDKIYALVSHLPQYLSFHLADFDTKQLSSSFFQQCFRLNNSNRYLWSEIFILNKKNLNILCENFTKHFQVVLQSLLQSKKNRFNILFPYITNLTKIPTDSNFTQDLQNNGKEIIARLLMAIAYRNIIKEDYKQYAGKGFADFTSIINILPSLEAQWFEKVFDNNNEYFLDVKHKAIYPSLENIESRFD
jgi:prephenate dehydrogenase